MSDLINMMRKELRELLTPSSLVSVIAVAIMFVFMGSMIGGEVVKASAPTTLGIIDEDDGRFSDESVGYLEDYYRYAYKVDPADYLVFITPASGGSADILKAMEEGKVTVALRFDSNYTATLEAHERAVIGTYFSAVSTSTFSGLSSALVSGMIDYVNSSLSASIMVGDYAVPIEDVGFIESPINTGTHTFINGVMYDDVTPYEISSALSSQNMFVPMIIMIVIVMIGNIVISSMGNEKENKTLETLLTLPVSRMTIVSGKLIAAGIAGLVFGLIYMVGMIFYINGLSTGSSINLADYGLGMNPMYWVLMVVSMFLGILCALSLCMILGAFAKNYKSAQTMIMPISMLALIPMFIMMFSTFTDLPALLQGIVFAIPFSHPMMVMQNLLFGDMGLVLAGIAYELLFAAAMIFITVRIYKSDILITGFSKEDFKRMIGRKTRKDGN